MKSYKDKDTLEKLYLKYGNQITISKILNCNPKTVSVWMKKFGIKTVGSQGARKNNYNQDFFEKIDTEEKAYWLGFIYADGCVYQSTDKKSYRLQINLKLEDIDLLIKFQESIGSNYKIQEKKIGNAFACLLKVNSTKMCNDLMNKGANPRKSLNLTFPSEKIVPKSLQHHFIRGYFDGDGSIYKVKGKEHFIVDICSNESFLFEMEKILLSKGLENFTYGKHRNSVAISLKTAKDINVIKLYKYMYDNATIYLERKKERFEEFKQVCPLWE